ncbi:MAG: hypothetical protein GY866_10975 [Proteobacteria bacterium]|nr:hypothetical protein [Pseudomonadota bacterium]
MSQKKIAERMFDAISDFDKEKAIEVAASAVRNDLDLVDFVQISMTPAMEDIGRKFESGELFLPHLVQAGDIFQSAMDVLLPKLTEKAAALKPAGRVVIGTVKGDVHSIGKDLVAIMLKTGGFEVHDLGVDVSVLTFIEAAEKTGAHVIALSALLSTALPIQKEVVEALSEKGVREKYKVMVGGAVASREFAEQIGADAYGKNAMEALEIAKRLCT